MFSFPLKPDFRLSAQYFYPHYYASIRLQYFPSFKFQVFRLARNDSRASLPKYFQIHLSSILYPVLSTIPILRFSIGRGTSQRLSSVGSPLSRLQPTATAFRKQPWDGHCCWHLPSRALKLVQNKPNFFIQIGKQSVLRCTSPSDCLTSTNSTSGLPL